MKKKRPVGLRSYMGGGGGVRINGMTLNYLVSEGQISAAYWTSGHSLVCFDYSCAGVHVSSVYI